VNVVLLHAVPLDSRMWEPQRGALTDNIVFAPDLYPLGSTMDEWAVVVLGQVDGELVAVGSSMGGYCALALARRAPERVRGLALVGARADADSPERRAARADTIELIEREGPEALWREMRPKLFPDGADPAVVERARRIALEQDPNDLVTAVEAIRDRPDSSDLVAKLECPLLVAVGEHDPFFPPGEARALAAEAPHARAVVFDGAGHLPSFEQPAEFNRLLADFFLD
jgi:pimeloyl-ACP methyl ester carboxylesterase